MKYNNLSKRALLYARVSTVRQKEEGQSIEAQFAAMRKYCSDHDVQILGEYQDAHSAKEGFDRPGYQQMKKDITYKRWKNLDLITFDASRFSRNMTDSFSEIVWLKQRGINVFHLNGTNMDNSDPFGMLLNMMGIAASENENKRHGMRTKEAMVNRLRKGSTIYSPPLGYDKYRVDDDTFGFKQNNDATAVRYAFELATDHTFPRREICRIVKELYGVSISRNGIYNILKNPAYIGYLEFTDTMGNPESVRSPYIDAIVDEDLYTRVNSRPEKVYVDKSTERIDQGFYLKGTIYCPNCNHALTYSKCKGRDRYYDYYECKNRKCDNQVRIGSAKAHEIVQRKMKSAQLPKALISKMVKPLAKVLMDGKKKAEWSWMHFVFSLKALKKRLPN